MVLSPYARTIKENPLGKYGDSFLELVCPKNISALWSFGSLTGVCLITQIITGLFLAIYFTPNVELAFDSTVYISRDVNFGWLIRSIHANGASIFFICLYVHTGRGLYYGSYRHTETWCIGVTLLLLVIVTAFFGYVLPWGQISYWAATVITNLLSAVPYLGADVVGWLWGGFSVSNATLVRFYAFHFILPLLISVISLVHLLFLHERGSRNPLGVSSSCDSIPFHPYFSVKDLVGFFVIWISLGVLALYYPYILIDAENFINANELVTPTHIQPEWYFLPIYAILRSIPNKLGGVVALIIRICILYFLPFIIKSNIYPARFNRVVQLIFWCICSTFIILIWIGRKPVEAPYEIVGRYFTIIYFRLFMSIYLVQGKEFKVIS